MNSATWTAIAAIIQAGATIVLVWITLKYARDTEKLAGTAESQIEQSNKELEQLREQAKVAREQLELEYAPNIILVDRLYLDEEVMAFAAINLGKYPVHINRAIVESENKMLIGREAGVLISGESKEFICVQYSQKNPYKSGISGEFTSEVTVDLMYHYGSLGSIAIEISTK